MLHLLTVQLLFQCSHLMLQISQGLLLRSRILSHLHLIILILHHQLLIWRLRSWLCDWFFLFQLRLRLVARSLSWKSGSRSSRIEAGYYGICVLVVIGIDVHPEVYSTCLRVDAAETITWKTHRRRWFFFWYFLYRALFRGNQIIRVLHITLPWTLTFFFGFFRLFILFFIFLESFFSYVSVKFFSILARTAGS